MYTIHETETFSKWLIKLKDIQAKVSILRRIERVRDGNFGDHKWVGQEVSELRVPVGPGYRVYYTLQGDEMVLLLVGGDKSTQSKDIDKAQQMCKELDYD